MTSIFGLGTAFLLGAFHAMEPGHGKTLITAFMMGNKGNLWHVLTMGISLALSHTLVLIVLGFGLNFFLHTSFNEGLTEAIEILSSILVILLGGIMIYNSKRKTNHCCQHHAHVGRQTYDYQKHTFSLGKAQKVNIQPSQLTLTTGTSPETSHKLTALAGFTSGLLPCPSALGAFFMSGTSNQLDQSIWFILVYVSGLVMALMLLAFLVQLAKSKLGNKVQTHWISHNASFLSGWVITGVGLVYLTLHLFHIH